MYKLKIILGSTRFQRIGAHAGEEIFKRFNSNPKFETEFVDLKDLGLPFYDESDSINSQISFSSPNVKLWMEEIT
jgi:NAD(P)H-dependent FMN reductase